MGSASSPRDQAIHNSKFFTGAAKQLPEYLVTEQVDYGIYLCVGHYDADFAPKRIKRVEETIKALADQKGIRIKLTVASSTLSRRNTWGRRPSTGPAADAIVHIELVEEGEETA